MVACTTFNDGFVATIHTTGRAQGDYYPPGSGFGFHRLGYGNSLRYGDTWTWQAAGLRCKSHTYGMECWSLYSGHGFILSRTNFSRY